jgi:hypothetical protein
MPTQVQCFDDPNAILEQPVCLNVLSKDVKGTLALNLSQVHACAQPQCKTLKTAHTLKLNPISHAPCDSAFAHALGGTFVVDRLVTAFDQDGMHRGFHAGDFVWQATPTIQILGRMSGMTNEGTHRPPAFSNCQTCDAHGVMEGRLCGRLIAFNLPAISGCQLIAAYRIKFDPSTTGGTGAVVGVIEGMVICPCH